MADSGKKKAALEALKYVRRGMALGLGTGSTTAHFVRLLGEANRKTNMELKCISTSIKTERLAMEYGLKLVGFGDIDHIDLAVDGADVVVGKNLIKGLGGGAITREKAVDYRAKEFVVIVDGSKVKRVFGGVVPLEVLPFASEAVKQDVEAMGAKTKYRMDGSRKFVTDNGNYILDAFFNRITAARKMERELNSIPGVVENGIFTRKCKVIVGR
ncbi:MAG: ribose-5-phosphate isomerase RpiA [Candidatus Micrarchaeota archaeon]